MRFQLSFSPPPRFAFSLRLLRRDCASSLALTPFRERGIPTLASAPPALSGKCAFLTAELSACCRFVPRFSGAGADALFWRSRRIKSAPASNIHCALPDFKLASQAVEYKFE
jgi:hypothetical protein